MVGMIWSSCKADWLVKKNGELITHLRFAAHIFLHGTSREGRGTAERGEDRTQDVTHAVSHELLDQTLVQVKQSVHQFMA